MHNCNLKTKKSDMNCSTTANLIIKAEDGKNVGRYYCPHTITQDFFVKLSNTNGYNIDKDVSKLSADIMEETLLNIPRMTFQVFEEDKIIQSIDICKQLYLIDIEHIDSNRITLFREIVISCSVTHCYGSKGIVYKLSSPLSF